MLEYWVSKAEEVFLLVKERFALRIAEFILRNEGPEARGKEFLAFSLKSAAGRRSSKLFQGYTCP